MCMLHLSALPSFVVRCVIAVGTASLKKEKRSSNFEMAENNLSELGGSVQLTAGSGGELIISMPAELARRGPRVQPKDGKVQSTGEDR